MLIRVFSFLKCFHDYLFNTFYVLCTFYSLVRVDQMLSTQISDDQGKHAFIAQIWLPCSQTWNREKKNPPLHLSSMTMLVPTMNVETKSCVSVSIYIQDAKTFYLH